MKKIKNDYQLVLWYLYHWKKPFSLKDVINDSMFYKFQTRLSEIEKDFGVIAERKSIPFTKKTGRKSAYNVYSPIDKNKILDIYDKFQ